MNNDRELLQQALDALINAKGYIFYNVLDDTGNRYDIAIETIRARLEQNDFNPDWDAMAVMVEEQQRMAKRIEELEARLAQPEPEPVAWFMEGTYEDGTPSFVQVNGETDPEFYVPLYTAPPKREWVGLTDEEIRKAKHHMVVGAYHYSFKQGAEWAEAKLEEKNK